MKIAAQTLNIVKLKTTAIIIIIINKNDYYYEKRLSKLVGNRYT